MYVLLFENLRGGGGMLNPDKFCPKQNVGTSFGKLNMLFFLHSGLDQRVILLIHFCRNKG